MWGVCRWIFMFFLAESKKESCFYAIICLVMKLGPIVGLLFLLLLLPSANFRTAALSRANLLIDLGPAQAGNIVWSFLNLLYWCGMKRVISIFQNWAAPKILVLSPIEKSWVKLWIFCHGHFFLQNARQSGICTGLSNNLLPRLNTWCQIRLRVFRFVWNFVFLRVIRFLSAT